MAFLFWLGIRGARNAVVRPNAFLRRKSAAFSACNAENIRKCNRHGASEACGVSRLSFHFLFSKNDRIFAVMRPDPDLTQTGDVRRCTKQYEIARKDHSTAHKTYIKSVFFHKKRARCRFDSAPAMLCVTPLPGRSFDRWCPQPARACWAWSGRRC